MSTYHSVNKQHLLEIFDEVQSRATTIVRQVDQVQLQLGETIYVGQNADELATEMNLKMASFVAITHQQLDQLLQLVTDNMNVVVTKLGSPPWGYTPIAAMALNATARAKPADNGTTVEIDTGSMETFAGEVEAQFKGVTDNYLAIEALMSTGGEGKWRGPEQEATATAVRQAIGSIVPEVNNVSASLQARIREQAALMGS
jgi:hypothetical protein